MMGGPLIQDCAVENQSGVPLRACRSGSWICDPMARAVKAGESAYWP
jgi:hypothetical protein